MAVHLGWAMKRGGIIPSWKRRYFVVSGYSLQYYADEGTDLKGISDLVKVTKIEPFTSPVWRGIALVTENRVWQIRAIEGDIELWSATLMEAAPYVRKPPPKALSSSLAVDPALFGPLPPSFRATNAQPGSKSFGVLLCGSSESGKTTLLRQLRFRFQPIAVTEADRRAALATIRQVSSTIRSNLVVTIQSLLRIAEERGFKVDSVTQARLVAAVSPFNIEPSSELAEAVGRLWQDQAIKSAFELRNDTVIPDNMDYFFRKARFVLAPEYLPTDEDILRARIQTIGVDRQFFEIEGRPLQFIDVGGQTNERTKIATVKHEVNALVYFVSLADFDKPLFAAEPKQPRIEDAVNFFSVLVEEPAFQDALIFLICNKFDLFSEKVRSTDRFARAFGDSFTGDLHNPDACVDFIIEKFRAVAPSKQIEVITQSALHVGAVLATTARIWAVIQERRPLAE
jgi:GTPase SAR1 family protein